MFEGRVGYKAAIIKLQYILFYIHNNALIRCLEEFKKNKFVPVEEAEKQIKLGAVITRLTDAIRRIKKSIWMETSMPGGIGRNAIFHGKGFEQHIKMRTNVKTAGARSLVEVIWYITIRKADSPKISFFMGCKVGTEDRKI